MERFDEATADEEPKWALYLRKPSYFALHDTFLTNTPCRGAAPIMTEWHSATGAPVRVVIAAGGLSTRVDGWAQLLPKGVPARRRRPALLDVLAGAGAGAEQQPVLVYHRYYEPFIGWAASALQPGATAGYPAGAGLPAIPEPAREQVRLSFVRQHGAYADITSVLNAAARLLAAVLGAPPPSWPARSIRAKPAAAASSSSSSSTAQPG